LKIDLHVHTIYSGDSSITLNDLLTQVRKSSLDGVAVTDHDTILGAERVSRILKIYGWNDELIVIPGIEVSTRGGHILGLNVSKPIPKGLSAKEAIERIHEAGGIAVAAHPQTVFKDGVGLGPKLLSMGLDAIEVINSSLFPFKPLTYVCKRFAEHYGLPQTAGSDSHIPETIGLAYTLIESEDKSVDKITEAISRGLTEPLGKGLPLSLRVKRVLKRQGKN